MKTFYTGLLGLTVAAALAATPGCGGGTERMNAPLPADELTGLGALIQAFDADLGEEGVPVDRPELEATLRADAELRRALFMPEESAFTTGTGQ